MRENIHRKLSSAMIACPTLYKGENLHITVLPLWRRVDLNKLEIPYEFREEVRCLALEIVNGFRYPEMCVSVIEHGKFGAKKNRRVCLLEFSNHDCYEELFRLRAKAKREIKKKISKHRLQDTKSVQILSPYTDNKWVPHITTDHISVGSVLEVGPPEYWDRDIIFL